MEKTHRTRTWALRGQIAYSKEQIQEGFPSAYTGGAGCLASPQEGRSLPLVRETMRRFGGERRQTSAGIRGLGPAEGTALPSCGPALLAGAGRPGRPRTASGGIWRPPGIGGRGERRAVRIGERAEDCGLGPGSTPGGGGGTREGPGL